MVPTASSQYRVKSFIDDVVRGETAYSNVLSVSTAGLGDGLTGTYYNGLSFSGSSVTRVDPAINFHWNAGQAPATRGPGSP